MLKSFSSSENWINTKIFAGPTAHSHARSWVLVFWLFGWSPLPPQWASGAQMCDCQNYSWSPGRSIFRSFFRFDFELNFGLVLAPKIDPKWALGPPRGAGVPRGPRPQWRPSVAVIYRTELRIMRKSKKESKANTNINSSIKTVEFGIRKSINILAKR